MPTRDRHSYGIIGAGALGGLYGAMLARAGFDVNFLLNSDFDHVSENGLRVDSILGDFHLDRPNVYRRAADMPACDVTILGLKTTNNHLLPDLLPAPTAGGGVVLVLQNGLDVEADAAAIVGADRVLGGCCFLCSNKIGPGHIHHLDYGRIVFGEYVASDRVSTRAVKIAAEMREAKIDANATDNLLQTRWQKLMWNIPFNGLSVVLDASTTEIINDSVAYALSESIVREVHHAATACGANVPEAAIEKTLDHTKKMVPYDSSMRLDFLAKRRIEAEAIFGNPIRSAKSHGVSMPRVETLYRQLVFMDKMNRAEPAVSDSSGGH